MKLNELILQAIPNFQNPSSLPNAEVLGVETDSRAVEKGFIFIAIIGTKVDGTSFVRDALARGAIAVVSDKKILGDFEAPIILVPDARLAASAIAAAFYDVPARSMKMIGMTGTNGKTTSSYILEHLLACEQKKVGVLGTVSHRFSGKEIPAAETTPGPVKLQKILAQMKAASCEYVAMEVSSHALDQKRVAGIPFSAALFTNLTQDHLDYHGTLENYFEAKLKLFSSLEPQSCAVVNADDSWGVKIPSKTLAKVVTYGVKQNADLKAQGILYGAKSTEWELVFAGKKIKVSSPLVGLHNVYNVLGVFGVLWGLGFSIEKAAQNLSSFPGVPGRLESLVAGQSFQVYIDFAHTPDGLLNVLQSLQEYRKKRLIVVFGCGGDRDRNKRPKMAKIAAECSDFVYVTSDNPRSENPKTIADEICAGFPADFKNFVVVLDRKKAIRQAFLSAREGDVVLLAGKGHEKTQIIGSQILPFSDREEAEKVLHGR